MLAADGSVLGAGTGVVAVSATVFVVKVRVGLPMIIGLLCSPWPDFTLEKSPVE